MQFRENLYLLFDKVQNLTKKVKTIGCCTGFLHNEAVLWHKKLRDLSITWSTVIGDEELALYLSNMDVYYSEMGINITVEHKNGYYDSRLGMGRVDYHDYESYDLFENCYDRQIQEIWKPIEAPDDSKHIDYSMIKKELDDFDKMLDLMEIYLYT